MGLAEVLKNGHPVVMVECTPPRGSDATSLKSCAEALGKSVDAICAPESEDGPRLSSLAACSHLVAAGAEPVLHLLTRDLNRIALQSALLGAASMGIRNVLCLSGRHQALTTSASARGVYDIDHDQLLRLADSIRKDGVLADGQSMDSPVDLVLGTDTNPFSDPIELQVIALEKAVRSGADFVITHGVFNLDRFNVWMTHVRERGLHEKTAVIAGVMPITSARQAVSLAEKYSHLDIGDDVVERLDSAQDKRAAGVHLAAETIAYVRKVPGVRGVYISTGEDYQLAADVIAAAGLARK
ncbi:MAG: hypothetical protein A2Z18_00805 [Armatimonadetes bacterium RBG_16_58_9]|nr:MAG: hypothetical protein A2Z18_00805 [Armatimonadetes bacterium RBG_16_58_9]